MGLWKSIKNIFTRSDDTDSAATTTASPARTGGFSGLYDFIGGGSALSVATVYCCVRLLSESVANLPFMYRKYKGGLFVDDISSRLHYLLTVQPDHAMSAFDFFSQLVENMLLEGNAYIVPVYNRATMDIDRLVLCKRHTVSHDIYNDLYTIADTVNGISGVYREDEIIHIKNIAPDGKNGVSVLTYARMTLDIAATGDRETRNRFANGGNVRGLVSNDKSAIGFGEYQDQQLEKTAESIDNRFQNGERIVSLPGQVDFRQISLSSTDMQFLESRKFTVRDICRFFRVPPSYVYDDTSNNYKSAEMASEDFLGNTLNPILRKIENEFLRKLVPPSLAGKRKFEFDRKGLYASSLSNMVKYQADTIAAGIYTVNEWRQKENKPPVPGGDTVLVSANLRNINEAGAELPATNDNNDEDE